MRTVGTVLLGTVVVLAVIASVLGLALRRPDIPYAVLEKKYATPASRYADLPNGVRVHYEDAGDPTKPTIVLLHGYGDSFLTWAPVVDLLTAGYHLIVPDMPGHLSAAGGWAAVTGAPAPTADYWNFWSGGAATRRTWCRTPTRSAAAWISRSGRP